MATREEGVTLRLLPSQEEEELGGLVVIAAVDHIKEVQDSGFHKDPCAVRPLDEVFKIDSFYLWTSLVRFYIHI